MAMEALIVQASFGNRGAQTKGESTDMGIGLIPSHHPIHAHPHVKSIGFQGVILNVVTSNINTIDK